VKKGTSGADAFSLVEITLALGVAAFALTAIVGLLSLTLKNSKSAMDDTLVAEMTGDLVNTLRKQDFTNISKATNVFFDISGKRINTLDSAGLIQGLSTSAAVAQGAVYECIPAVTADTNTLSPNGSANLWQVTLNFRWPAGVNSTVNQKTIHADIARY